MQGIRFIGARRRVGKKKRSSTRGNPDGLQIWKPARSERWGAYSVLRGSVPAFNPVSLLCMRFALLSSHRGMDEGDR